MVDAISHSRFWSSSAIFILEDDPQAGVDHVDGHRGPLLVISPYAKRGVIDNTYYTQINVVKTIEQILGIAPMNQEDLAAEPMFGAFTDKPNMTPYTVLPNQVPLTYGLATSPTTAIPSAQATGVATAMTEVYRQWVRWSRRQDFSKPDQANPAQLNRVDWYSATGWRRPYPGDRKILAPGQVPGRNLPAADIGGG
jgi:hypothetical protein